jgi:hypothetical protein
MSTAGQHETGCPTNRLPPFIDDEPIWRVSSDHIIETPYTGAPTTTELMVTTSGVEELHAEPPRGDHPHYAWTIRETIVKGGGRTSTLNNLAIPVELFVVWERQVPMEQEDGGSDDQAGLQSVG